jgi:D-alanyl-D-alanine carboxypeptidase/D-alanyl-D-alanine-endopeptidase (penicillin-binding protein 4)
VKQPRKGTGRAGSKGGTAGARAARIALLLVLNFALLAVLWQVARPRLLAQDPASGIAAAESAAAAGTPAALSSDLAALALTSVGPAPTAFESRRDHALEGRIRAAIQDALAKAETESKGRVRAAQCSVAVHVRTAAGGTEIASIDAARAQRPASNLKLVTTAAALVLLGPDWEFTTLFTSDAPIQDGALRGDLVVHGGGDPLYDASSGGSVAARFAPVVRQLKALGITRIEGDLVLDEGRFLAPGPGPAWPAENQHWSEFCALSGALSANAGCITARVRPGRVGRPATVEVQPAGHGLPQRIAVTTGKARSKLDVRVGAVNGTVIVEGSIPADVDAWECRFAAPDPVALFGGALRRELESNGIRVAGSLRRDRTQPHPGSRPLAKLATSILDVLEPINAHSNNACADQLYFALGNAQFGRGDRDGGRAATSLALQRLGVPDDGFQQVDGSGLSRDDRVSARQITALLAGVLRRGGPAADALLASMAAPRADGTLDDRLAGLEGRLRAKTGFIGGTSALSGLIEADDGQSLAFSILVEYPVFEGLNTRVWKPMEDRMCRVIAGGAR